MKLFISYAHADEAKILDIVEIFETAGHDPWFDHGLLPGQDWQQKLEQEIIDADIFVYIMSAESLASEWCQWEFNTAIKHSKPILPILIDKTATVPDTLSPYQYADFTQDDEGKAIAKLLGGLTEIAVTIPRSEMQSLPKNPRGKPNYLKEKSRFNTRIIVGIVALIGFVGIVAVVFAPTLACYTQANSAWYSEGTDAYRSGDFDEAVSAYHCAEQRGMEFEGLFYNLGLTYNALEDYDNSIHYFDKAENITNQDSRIYYNRGGSYSSSKQYEAALADYDRAIELGYTPPERAESAIANTIRLMGDFNTAIERLEDITNRYPTSAPPYQALGDAYYCNNQMDDAFASYETYVSLITEPDSYVLDILEDQPQSSTTRTYFICVP